MSRGNNKIYVGNLPSDVATRDIDDLFYKYGEIINIDIKSSRGAPFAFVEFASSRDAADAVHGRDGYKFDGYPLRVEFPRAARSSRGGFGGKPGGGRGGGGGGGGGGPTRRSDFRVLISGLPPTGSWQDLKDHMREAGDVGFADVFRGGTGVVEFLRYEDMKYAIRKLDDSKFKSHEGETSYIRVQEEKRSRSRSRSAQSRSKSRSASYTP